MHVKGKCACGAVTFEADGDPIVQLYCHCRSCQLAHAAPLSAAAIFNAAAVRYDGELRAITITARTDASKRFICPRCGTRVINEPVPEARAIHPALCESARWFSPSMHVQWQDHVIEIADGLPRFLDYPKELGGTGERA